MLISKAEIIVSTPPRVTLRIETDNGSKALSAASDVWEAHKKCNFKGKIGNCNFGAGEIRRAQVSRMETQV